MQYAFPHQGKETENWVKFFSLIQLFLPHPDAALFNSLMKMSGEKISYQSKTILLTLST